LAEKVYGCLEAMSPIHTPGYSFKNVFQYL